MGPNDRNTMHGNAPMNGASYANVVKRKKKHEIVNKSNNVFLGAGDFHLLDDNNKIVLGKVKEATLIPQLYQVCQADGFTEAEIKYVGGMWVWFEFMTVLFSDDDLEEQLSSESEYEEDDYSVVDEDGVNLDQFILENNGNKDTGKYDGFEEGFVEEETLPQTDQAVGGLEDAYESHDDVGNNIKAAYNMDGNKNEVHINIKEDGGGVLHRDEASLGSRKSNSDVFPPSFDGMHFYSSVQSRSAPSGKTQFSHVSSSNNNVKKFKKKHVIVGSLIEVMERYVEYGKILRYDFT
ncbi:unnamed protein product [Lactuca saligna]|uniref:Uncharacterized protein n=1 Tax=Lactuca saligna TaxID=75948 RepID=A0AA35VH81_LACSI|nr:unnamed protein product [Lactuca saligna]